MEMARTGMNNGLWVLIYWSGVDKCLTYRPNYASRRLSTLPNQPLVRLLQMNESELKSAAQVERRFLHQFPHDTNCNFGNGMRGAAEHKLSLDL